MVLARSHSPDARSLTLSRASPTLSIPFFRSDLFQSALAPPLSLSQRLVFLGSSAAAPAVGVDSSGLEDSAGAKLLLVSTI